MGSSLLVVLLASTAIGLAHLGDDKQPALREKRGAPSTALPRWKLPIPYRISNDFSDSLKTSIKRGVASIMAKTCIDFVDNSKEPYQLVYIRTPGTCASPVGDKRFTQGPGGNANHNVSLSEECAANLGNVQHETAHALGIGHTQSRADRDKYVIIDETNIGDGYEANFYPIGAAKSPDYGIPFEYGSRMMYSPYMYRRREAPVVSPIDDSYLTAQGTAPELTFNDWKIINIHYNCTGKFSTICSGVNTVCQNGGYPHPRDCKRCICGDFYDGNFCEIERGVKHLHQTGNDKVVILFNKTGEVDLTGLAEKDWANYNVDPLQVIKAPENSRIRITIEEQLTRTVFYTEEHGYVTGDPSCPMRVCFKTGVEIADGDLLLAGKKFCCSEKDIITSFVSKSNVVGYRAYSHKGTNFRSKVTFKIEPGTAPATTTTATSPPTIPTTTATPTTTTGPPTAAPTTTTTKPPTIPTTTTAPTTTTKPPTAPPTTTTTTSKPITDEFVCEY